MLLLLLHVRTGGFQVQAFNIHDANRTHSNPNIHPNPRDIPSPQQGPWLLARSPAATSPLAACMHALTRTPLLVLEAPFRTSFPPN
jgi:hypothetical protein